MSTLPWNLATKDLHGHELLREKLEEKIKKVEKHLQHYPAGSLHLQIVLERHPRKPLFVAKLTLHVPSNILRSEKSAWDVIKAFDDAVKALLRELASLKADLRREAYWKRKDRRKELHAKSAGGRLIELTPNGLGAMDRSADFVQLLSQFVQQIEGGMDSGLRTWANETIRERLEVVEKDLPGPLEEIEIYLRSEAVDRTVAKKTSAV